ncbi:MAG: hypothetical protein IPP36_08625 [Nitrosomonadales bacterium]|nr:hypothetical protein [Nitrosomonadales bacterium]
MVDEGLIEKFALTIEPFITQESPEIDEHMEGKRCPLSLGSSSWKTVINALVHRDWTRAVDIEATNYSDRLEVISPGKLQNSMTISKMVAGQRSPRNTLIVKSFVIMPMLIHEAGGAPR